MSRLPAILALLTFAGCVSPIGPEQHQAALDRDRDGVSGAADCAPADPAVHPDAVEWCNGIDDDCDGQIDGPDARGVRPFWPDADGDGFGDVLSVAAWDCAPPAGHVDNDADCQDDDADVQGPRTWYADQDQDGFGAGPAIEACVAPQGAVASDGDCDDGDPTRNPGQTETCDGRDEDCDGTPDNGAVTTTWYGDVDGDGHGGSSVTVDACVAPPGWFALADDCDDGDPEVNPLAYEVCNGIDDNCNGSIDDNDPSILSGAMNYWYQDLDGDGHGDGTVYVQACEQPAQHTNSGSDCDDGDPAIHPDAPELCDGADNDCDTYVDEEDADSPDQLWYLDGDLDGYGGATSFVGCSPPADHVADSLDCDDADDTVNPDALEVCGDGVDNDCDQVGCAPAGDLSPGDADLTVASLVGGSEHGAALSAVDWTDDGAVDLAIGGPGASRVLLFDGPRGTGALDDGDAWATLTGPGGSRFGEAVAGGSLLSVGAVDLVVGAPASEAGAAGGGAVWLLSGPVPSGTVDVPAVADASVVGAAGEGIGAVLAVGDLGAGPTDDLAVGAPASGVGGRVGVFLGLVAGQTDLSAADVLLDGAAGDEAGAALVFGGDLDGDGLDELVVGSPGSGSDAGVVDRIEPVAGTFAVDAASEQRWTGEAGQRLGGSLAAGGDLSGDGYADLLIGGAGASAAHPGGVVLVVRGRFAPVGGLAVDEAHAVLDRPAGLPAAFSLASGDFDDDGERDVLVADASGTGLAWLLRGPVSGALDLDADAHARFLPGAAPARFGASALLADLDGDGIDDACLGSPLAGVPAEPGTVTLFFGDGF